METKRVNKEPLRGEFVGLVSESVPSAFTLHFCGIWLRWRAMRSFCSEPSNKKPWKPHSGVGTKGSQKKELFQSCSSTSTGDSQVIISTPELSSAFSAGFLTPLWKSLLESSKDISNLFSLSLSLKLLLLLFSLSSKQPYHLLRYPSLKLGTYSWLLLCHFKFSHHQVLSSLPSNKFHYFLLLGRSQANAFGVSPVLTRADIKIFDQRES